jgi:hypothetical protein
VRLDQRAHDGEPEAGAAVLVGAPRIRALEAVEDAGGSDPAGHGRGGVVSRRSVAVKEAGRTVRDPSGRARTSTSAAFDGGVTDLLYTLITVVTFVLLALLVGVLDRWLGDEPAGRAPATAPDLATEPAPAPGAVR